MPNFRLHKIALATFLLCAVGLRAQFNTDSLKVIINNPKVHDTTKLAAIALLIGNLYESGEMETYNNLMGKIAQQNLQKNPGQVLRKRYTMFLAAYYNNVGARLEETRSPKTLAYIDKALNMYYNIGAYDEYYSGLVSKGLSLSRRKRYKEAIDCYYKALKFFEQNEAENSDGISYVYSNLGVLYGEQDQWPESIAYMKKSLVYLDKKKEEVTIEDDLQKFAMHYNIGAAYITIKDYGQATDNLNIALALAKKHAQNSYISFALGKLGLIDMQQNKFDEAEKKLTQAYAVSESGISKSFSQVKLGEVYFHKKDYAKARSFLEKGFALAEQINNADLQQQASELLYKIYKIQGNYKESVAMLETFQKLKDATKIEENQNELKQQQLKYDYEKKELRYKLRTQKESAAKNNVLIVLSSVLVLLLMGAYWLFRNYKQKQALSVFEKNELNRKLLLTQMNPHFIFNSIDNIQSLIYHKKDDEAVNYLAKFSKLTRQILENSSENYITLDEEVEMIGNYIGIQQLLFNNKFDYRIHIDESINPEAILLPPMLTQPFIENAIKHGFRHMESKGFIDIHFIMKDNKLFFEIADNGSGFDDAEKPGQNKSMAMRITKERLWQISKKKDFEVQKHNTTDDENKITGARVFFEIPYLYEN
jgi:tetratricopeptide (TPR) repeat protein